MPKGKRKTIKEQVDDAVKFRQKMKDAHTEACKAVDVLIEKMNKDIAELKAMADAAVESDDEIAQMLNAETIPAESAVPPTE